MANEKRSRIEMAREVAAELLDELETGTALISHSLMRAKRLARLLRDEDAQRWLTLEINGYPTDFYFGSLGSCRRYAEEGGRTKEGKYYPQSLPHIEAEMRSRESVAPTSQSIPSVKVDNYTEAGATRQVIDSIHAHEAVIRSLYIEHSSLYASMCGAIHAYVTDTSLALELGDEAESIFESARGEVDCLRALACSTGGAATYLN